MFILTITLGPRRLLRRVCTSPRHAADVLRRVASNFGVSPLALEYQTAPMTA